MNPVSTDQKLDSLIEAFRRNQGVGNLKNALDTMLKIIELLREQIATKMDAPTPEQVAEIDATLAAIREVGAKADETLARVTGAAPVAIDAPHLAEDGVTYVAPVGDAPEAEAAKEPVSEATAEPAVNEAPTDGGEEKATPKRGGRPKGSK